MLALPGLLLAICVITVLGPGLVNTVIAIAAFSALAEAGVPDKFPKLRVGFIETGASWIPFLHADLMAKMRSNTRPS